MSITNLSLDNLRKLNDTLALVNGPATFSNDREAFGYIKEEEKLAVPFFFKYGYDYLAARNVADEGFQDTSVNVDVPTIFEADGTLKDIDNAFFQNMNGLDVVLVNSAINVGRLGNGADADFCAVLRGILTARGVLFAMPDPVIRENFTKDTRCVFLDEVVRLDIASTIKAVKANIGAVCNLILSDKGAHMLRNWVSLSLPVDYVFMSRTHHFVGDDDSNIIAARRDDKDQAGYYSYAQIYRAIWKSAFPEVPFPVDDAKKLFRTALHPFGVNAFRLLERVYRESDKLPSGMLARARPAPAGVAKITTASAILRMMEGSPFFLTVRDVLQSAAADVHYVADQIKANPAHFHQHHILYGEPALTDNEKKAIEHATTLANGLAPLLVGYVSVECKGAPIASQKTLNKPALDQAGLLNRVKRIFTRLDLAAEQDDPVDVITRMIAPGTLPPANPITVAPINIGPANPGAVVPVNANSNNNNQSSSSRTKPVKRVVRRRAPASRPSGFLSSLFGTKPAVPEPEESDDENPLA